MRSVIFVTLNINVMVLLFVTYNLVSWYRLCGDIHCPAGTPLPTGLHLLTYLLHGAESFLRS